MTDKTPSAIQLPDMPNIPASNASYNKRAKALYDAAKTGQAPAVLYLRDTIKGTNTYCKMLRRYADSLVAAITPAPEDDAAELFAAAGGSAAHPAVKAEVAKMKKAKATKVVEPKPQPIVKNHPDAYQGEPEPEPEPKAKKFKAKAYTTLSSAKSAIAKAGLGAMVVEYPTINGKVQPVVQCENPEDVAEVNERGFAAEAVGADA